MRKSLPFYVLVLLLALLFGNSCNTLPLNDLQSGIDKIAARYVPDRREGISDLTLAAGKKRELVIYGETDCPELIQEVLDTLKDLGFVVIDSSCILPSIDLGDYRYGIVSLSVINLRKEPGHNAELVSQAVMGAPVRILKKDNYWLLIQTPDKYIAWTESSSVHHMNESEMKDWKDSPKLICMNNSGWIYESPEEKGVIGDLVAGCIMKSSGKLKGYTKVVLPDGRTGVVRDNIVTEYNNWKSGAIADGGQIYKVASSMMGLPYLWGGSSAKAVDCSGFVQTVYFMNGIILSRDASLQALHGLAVDISNGWTDLQTGDLLFFGSVRNSKARVTHVAIYKGDSEFIHSSGRVIVNSLDSTHSNYSSYRKNSILSARRIIGSHGSEGIVYVKDHNWY
jgi:uncharacterized protein YgiM (DUF1202 family)